jgi:SseB protein C-terminal domain
MAEGVDKMSQIEPVREDLRGPSIRIVRAADGEPERALIEALVPRLRRDLSVLSAYLAVIAVGQDAPEMALILGFSEGVERPDTIRACASIFYEMFNHSQSLAIIPLNDGLERALAEVTPFFVASAG